ncbi:NAD-dependent DNA ligase LigA [Coprococcus catus]|uniref:NAD-dependent DNA ligase LigA n=1 Tax=Coprococcus catus TaxID=116085 RepID=UPI001C8C91C1|nr:NAD-dependent DNA ligase LigA [Coprococcus catus]MBX9230102.1 NAD-dependent DNA ligase LigA [Coprococcus catus]MCT6798838.1 NAD-dependent DNA ligase LigA [Coprococcus catus]
MTSKADRIKELTEILNRASKAYYMQDTEIMSNYEYDALYDELVQLEKETGITLSNSPTIHVGYEVVSELPKEEHEYPMLSLDKTKDVQTLSDWLGDQMGVLSWKMDGLTIVLTYDNGELVKAVTRGNGYVGEVITNNAKVFKNVPHRIAFKGKLTLRGEAVIKYSDFNALNNQIEDSEAKYKNPRNLCSGSVRQLNNAVTAERNVFFFAFTLVVAEGEDFHNSRMQQFEWLRSQGFDVVEHVQVDRESLPSYVSQFAERITENDFPSDGLVLILEDIAYGESLGTTAKFPRNAIAFKWADEIRETHLLDVEWSASRTGLINPIAVFEPVELEGTTVSRASLHNISILRALQLGRGDLIQVYKANMIIPQIAENLTRSDSLEIPSVCPVCGETTEIRSLNDVSSLYCLNEECPAKHVKQFSLFVSRDAFNIEGMSEATLEKLIQHGFLHEPADLFHLDNYHDEIVQLDGFGEKSYQRLMASVQKARKITLAKLIYSLGILNIGLSNARLLCRHYKNDLQALMSASTEELTAIDGIGPVIAGSFTDYFADEHHKKELEDLLGEVEIEQENFEAEDRIFDGKIFVITGSLEHFKNRNALKELLEEKGAKVAGSVSSKTSYLINNDAASASSKNKKARELGVSVITEEELMALMGKAE